MGSPQAKEMWGGKALERVARVVDERCVFYDQFIVYVRVIGCDDDEVGRFQGLRR